MNHEYDALWKELLEWQNRRVALLTLSSTVVIGVLTVGQSVNERVPWWVVSLGLLLFLSAACRLTAYAEYANMRIGTFLEVFHDPSSELKWELRKAMFIEEVGKQGRTTPSLNAILLLFYSLLGCAAVLLPRLLFSRCPDDSSAPWIYEYGGDFFIVCAAAVLFCASLVRLRQQVGRRGQMCEVWKAVQIRSSGRILL